MLVVGRFALPLLFAQAARTKSPELFLAISLLTVILASLATGAVGLSPILGALIAGILIAETEYHAEVEAITAPLAGLALGIFLITVGMRIDLDACAREWPLILGATAAVLLVKAAITAALVRASGVRARRRGRNRRDDGEPVGNQPDRARRCGRRRPAVRGRSAASGRR